MMELNGKNIKPTDLVEFCEKYKLALIRRAFRDILAQRTVTPAKSAYNKLILLNGKKEVVFRATLTELKQVPYLLIIPEEDDAIHMDDPDDWKLSNKKIGEEDDILNNNNDDDEPYYKF